MKIDVNEVIVNRISGQNMQEAAPGQDLQELRAANKAPEMRDMTVGSVIAASLLHPAAAQSDGQSPKPENVRERYKLANRVLDALEGDGAVELSAKEATLVQGAVCTVYTQAAVSGKICELLDG